MEGQKRPASDTEGGGGATEGKRPRLEPQEPTKVVFCRNVPDDCTESDMQALCFPYGGAAKVLIMKGKAQALVEMMSVEAAGRLIAAHQAYPQTTVVRGRPILLSASNHKEVTLKPLASGPPIAAGGRVLHVVVTRLMYPVTLGVLHSLFSQYGVVEKIVMFERAEFSALVQMATAEVAAYAQSALDGQCIFTGCCLLKISPSRLEECVVRANNEKAWDYTNDAVPPAHNPAAPAGGAVGGAPLGSPTAAKIGGGGGLLYTPQLQYGGGAGGLMPGGVGAGLLPPHGGGGGLLPHGGGGGGGGLLPNGGALLGGPSAVPGYPVAYPHGGDAMGGGLGGYGVMGGGGGGSQVLLVNGLPENMFTVQELMVLFGAYGDVTKVKIMFNKRSTALIQFVAQSHAETAMYYLNDVEITPGHKLAIAVSRRYQTIDVAGKDTSTDGVVLSQDFTGSPLHRFKREDSNNQKNIAPPSATLHLSGLAGQVTEDVLKEMFGKHGTVTSFKWISEEKKMALLVMGSVPEAIQSLVRLHNTKLGDRVYVRITFSKVGLVSKTA